MLKGIIFDMDGVIIDSEPTHSRAIINALKEIEVSLPFEYPYRFIGSTTEYMLNRIIEDYSLSISAKALNDMYDKALEDLIKEKGYIPVPHVLKLIEHLYQDGYSLAIASSSTPEEIASVTEALQISSCFQKLVSGTTVKYPKPAPDVFLKTAAELNLSPEECIIIEDSSNGVKAAKASGIPVIGYLNPNSGNQDLSLAAILVEGFEEIDSVFLERIYCRYHNFPVIIAETNRLIIKEIPPEDVPLLHELYQDTAINSFLPDVYRASFDSIETAIEKHSAYIKNMYHFYNVGLWGVYLKSGELIGQFGIEPRQNEGYSEMEIGYLIGSSYQNKGYGAEAIKAVISYSFNSLDATSLIALITPDNSISVKLAQKAGFLYESDTTRDGKLYNKYRIINTL